MLALTPKCCGGRGGKHGARGTLRTCVTLRLLEKGGRVRVTRERKDHARVQPLRHAVDQVPQGTRTGCLRIAEEDGEGSRGLGGFGVFGFWVLGFGFWVLGFLGFGFWSLWVQGFVAFGF